MLIESEKLIIETNNGNLEALLDKPSEITNKLFDYIAVCCHPHSLHGGTLTNKVVNTLSRTLAGRGIPSIRFNFRGVGNSEGEYDDGVGEQKDLANVVDWLQAKYPERKLILAGFSFGAFVSIMAAKQLGAKMLISVAPPVGRFDFSSLELPNCPWHIFQGDEDELVNYDDVENWVCKQKEDEQKTNLEFISVKGASHFFHGKLVELRGYIEDIIN